MWKNNFQENAHVAPSTLCSVLMKNSIYTVSHVEVFHMYSICIWKYASMSFWNWRRGNWRLQGSSYMFITIPQMTREVFKWEKIKQYAENKCNPPKKQRKIKKKNTGVVGRSSK